MADSRTGTLQRLRRIGPQFPGELQQILEIYSAHLLLGRGIRLKSRLQFLHQRKGQLGTLFLHFAVPSDTIDIVFELSEETLGFVYEQTLGGLHSVHIQTECAPGIVRTHICGRNFEQFFQCG